MKARSRASKMALALAVVVTAARLAPEVPEAQAAASGSVFEVAQVITEVKRQLAAADAGAADKLRIEDAQLELGLVENPNARGGSLVVPGADFAAGSKEETPRPSLKHRLVIEVQPARRPAAEAAAGGRLTQMIGELRAGVQPASAADPAFDLKKFTIDLDFALERDGKGGMQLVLFARERRIEPLNVHGLKLRLAASEGGELGKR